MPSALAAADYIPSRAAGHGALHIKALDEQLPRRAHHHPGRQQFERTQLIARHPGLARAEAAGAEHAAQPRHQRRHPGHGQPQQPLAAQLGRVAPHRYRGVDVFRPRQEHLALRIAHRGFELEPAGLHQPDQQRHQIHRRAGHAHLLPIGEGQNDANNRSVVRAHAVGCHRHLDTTLLGEHRGVHERDRIVDELLEYSLQSGELQNSDIMVDDLAKDLNIDPFYSRAC